MNFRNAAFHGQQDPFLQIEAVLERASPHLRAHIYQIKQNFPELASCHNMLAARGQL